MPSKIIYKNTKALAYVIKQRIKESPDVITLNLKPKRRRGLIFSPGQYVQVYIPEFSRPYSISNPPNDKFLSLTIKKQGVVSTKIHQLKVGDKLSLTGPYGFFTLDNLRPNKDLIFLAGGIGITPFRSMIKTLLNNRFAHKITLFYSEKTDKDILFKKEFKKLSSRWNNFKVIYNLTKEKKKPVGIRWLGRLDTKFLKKQLKALPDKYYFICGSVDFVTTLWEDLKKAGVKDDNIKTETFY